MSEHGKDWHKVGKNYILGQNPNTGNVQTILQLLSLKSRLSLVFQADTAKMCHSPKVDDKVDIKQKFLNTYFWTFF